MKLNSFNSSHKSQTRRSGTRGFTLVEMLLVLMIIATLAALVLPKMVGRGKQAQVTATQAQIAAFKTALEAFEVDNGYFPKSMEDLVQQPREAQNWHGPYLDKIPQDPWNHDYIYVCPGKHNPNGFDISSAGPDGREGTDDDIVNWQTK
jgi:general secretion pathway protein G